MTDACHRGYGGIALFQKQVLYGLPMQARCLRKAIDRHVSFLHELVEALRHVHIITIQ